MTQTPDEKKYNERVEKIAKLIEQQFEIYAPMVVGQKRDQNIAAFKRDVIAKLTERDKEEHAK